MDFEALWDIIYEEVKRTQRYQTSGTDKSVVLPEEITDNLNEIRQFVHHPSVSDTPTLRKVDFEPEGTYVLVSDLHVPYVNYRVIDRIFAEHAAGVILAGDILDAEKFSPFASKKHVPFIEEYKAALDIIHEFSVRFAQVIMIPGNHDRRIAKTFYRQLENADYAFMVNPDPLYYLAKGVQLLDGFELSEPIHHNVAYYDNALLFGNVIIDHPDFIRSTPGATVRKVIRHFLAHTREPFDYVIIGHTHRHAEITELGRVGIEAGCACIDLPYTYRTGKRPEGETVNMYMLLHFEDGKLAGYEKKFVNGTHIKTHQ